MKARPDVYTLVLQVLAYAHGHAGQPSRCRTCVRAAHDATAAVLGPPPTKAPT